MILDAAAILLIAGGGFFLLVSTVGLLRLPDFFTRAHAVGKSETLGSLLVLAGIAVHGGDLSDATKLFLIVLFIAVTNPSGIHVLTRAALRSGMEIWVLDKDRPRPRRAEASAGREPPAAGGTPEDAR